MKRTQIVVIKFSYIIERESLHCSNLSVISDDTGPFYLENYTKKIEMIEISPSVIFFAIFLAVPLQILFSPQRSSDARYHFFKLLLYFFILCFTSLFALEKQWDLRLHGIYLLGKIHIQNLFFWLKLEKNLEIWKKKKWILFKFIGLRAVE